MNTKTNSPAGIGCPAATCSAFISVGSDQMLFTVAEKADLIYIVDLEKKNKESLGFLPKMAIEERQQKGRIFMGRLNGEPYGYLLFDQRGGDVNILQACIQYDARRRLYGAALYQWALATWSPDWVRLKCAADLESNLFWQSMGLMCVGVKEGGVRRGRKINVWHHYLTPQLLTVKATPAFQRREDCKDKETGFLSAVPKGFTDEGSLGKLAWSNRKIPQQNDQADRRNGDRSE